MKRFILLVGIFFPPLSYAGNLISSMTWTESGDYKMPQQDQVPFVSTGPGVGFYCSTCTISRTWDGTTIKLFGAKGELLTWVTYLIGGNSAATNVMVTLSSFTGTGLAAGTGFSAVTRSSGSVWDFSQSPYSLYKYTYLQKIGKSEVDTYWDNSEYDEQQLPKRMQVPCVLNGSNQCPPTNALWTARQLNNKFIPDPAVPIEEFLPSSFTVAASSSQAIGVEVYISTSMIANSTYTATLTVYEGAAVDTTIPVALYVYNVTLPSTATLPVVTVLGYPDIDVRFYGTRSPANDQVDPYLTGHVRGAAFLHRHKIITVGDPFIASAYYPSADYLKHQDGSAFKESYGLSPNTGPGYGIGDTIYWADVYGSAIGTAPRISTSVFTGSTGYCTYISSELAYCLNHGLNCQFYTPNDEASTALLHTTEDTLASHNNTDVNCLVNGSVLPFLQTGGFQTTLSTAPNINTIMSTQWLNTSTITYQTQMNSYLNYSTRSVGGYNSNLGVGSLFALEDDGLTPREAIWGYQKAQMQTVFLWFINYWSDVNNCPQTNNGYNALGSQCDNDNFNIDKDFGYDAYPSTNSVKGHYGFNFTSKDGLMLYPGTDTLNTPSYGFNGFIGSWRLNQLTRGIQDADIIALAKAVNLSSATTIVNQQVQDVVWLRTCFNSSDCSYSYGPRPWNEQFNSWEASRESLLQLISNSTVPVISSALTASGQVSVAFTYQILASSNPTSYSASPLPAGLSLNSGTGLISGTPTTVGVTNTSISASNGNGIGPSVTLVITISAAPGKTSSQILLGPMKFQGSMVLQ